MTRQQNTIVHDHPISQSVHFVNIQTYDGGWDGNGGEDAVKTWTDLGFQKSQLTYGMYPENTLGIDDSGVIGEKHSPTIKDATDAFEKKDLAKRLGGINLWRLNAGNFRFVSHLQVRLHACMHDTAAPETPTWAELEKLWGKTQGQQADHFPKSSVHT